MWGQSSTEASILPLATKHYHLLDDEEEGLSIAVLIIGEIAGHVEADALPIDRLSCRAVPLQVHTYWC